MNLLFFCFYGDRFSRMGHKRKRFEKREGEKEIKMRVRNKETGEIETFPLSPSALLFSSTLTYQDMFQPPSQPRSLIPVTPFHTKWKREGVRVLF